MSLPRPVFKNDVIFITRRTIERTFFLRPDDELNQGLKYLLGLAAQRFQVLPVAACFMSDHYHLQAWDVAGRHPEFTQWFHRQITCFVNHHRGRPKGTVWDPSEQVNVARVVDDEAKLENAAYILANPVAAYAVHRGTLWPGVRSTPQAATLPPEVVHRPDFFRPDSPHTNWPDVVEVRFLTPPTDVALSPGAFAGHLANRVGNHEGRHRAHAATDGIRFEGRDSVLARHWTERATSPEGPPTANRKPNVVARSSLSRSNALLALGVFRRRYREARTALREGIRRTFPSETWKLE